EPRAPLPFPTRRSSDLGGIAKQVQRCAAQHLKACQHREYTADPGAEFALLRQAGFLVPLGEQRRRQVVAVVGAVGEGRTQLLLRSEEHTSELQSRENLV